MMANLTGITTATHKSDNAHQALSFSSSSGKDTSMKKLTIALTALAITLAGCSSATEPAPTPPGSAASSSPETSESSSSMPPTSEIEEAKPETTKPEAKQPDPTMASPQADTPVAEAPAVEQAPAEPVVVECLAGTPGSARWSDGTVSYSQWCFDTMGGEQHLEDEANAGVPPTPEQQQPRKPSPWVQGQIDWANCLDSGKTKEQCREELN